MLVLINTKKHLLFLLFIAKLSFHQAIAEENDVPIPCQQNKDCFDASITLENVTCNDGFCVCKNDREIKNCSSMDIVYHSNRNAGRPIFRSCKVNQDCQLNNSFCNTSISQCECQKDYILSNTKKMCLKKADALDFPCTEDKQCLAFLPNTTCQTGQCRCIFGYHYVPNGCYKTIGIGKSCNQTKECAHVIGAVCTDTGICNCGAGTVINEDQKRCLSVVSNILENCAESVQCAKSFPNALCIDGSCQCQNQYHFEPVVNQCFVNKKFGESCGNTYECYQAEDENATLEVKALECAKSVCVCAKNYERQNDRCVNEGSHLSVPVLPIFLATIVCVAFSKQK